MPTHQYYLNKHILNLIPDNLDQYRILDCCSGFGDWAFILRTRKKGNPFIRSVEIDENLTKKQTALKLYNGVFSVDIEEYLNSDHDEFNIIFLIEAIEHMKKKKSIRVLKKLDSLWWNIFIVTTPRKFTINPNETGTIWNQHKSGDYELILRSMGFKKIKYSFGFELMFIFKNLYLFLMRKPLDSISDIWYKQK